MAPKVKKVAQTTAIVKASSLSLSTGKPLPMKHERHSKGTALEPAELDNINWRKGFVGTMEKVPFKKRGFSEQQLMDGMNLGAVRRSDDSDSDSDTRSLQTVATRSLSDGTGSASGLTAAQRPPSMPTCPPAELGVLQDDNLLTEQSLVDALGPSDNVTDPVAYRPGTLDGLCWMGCGTGKYCGKPLQNIGNHSSPKFVCPPCAASRRGWASQFKAPTQEAKRNKLMQNQWALDNQEEYKALICKGRLDPKTGTHCNADTCVFKGFTNIAHLPIEDVSSYCVNSEYGSVIVNVFSCFYCVPTATA